MQWISSRSPSPVTLSKGEPFHVFFYPCDVLVGSYGMTENCATCSRVWVRDPTSTGTVGAPQPSVEMKLVDVPSMGYTSEDVPFPRGEICSRGPGCFRCYYKGCSRLALHCLSLLREISDPKTTESTIDSEGWVHTGDIGELDNQGRFKIIDRIKVKRSRTLIFSRKYLTS